MTVAALVLAGGAGRRLGGADKPLLALGDGTILDRVLARLRAEPAVAIALSANGDPARFARFALPVLGDGSFAGAGPLAGILAGLDWAAALGATSLLSVPGDTPFLPADLIRTLSPAPARAWADGRVQSLVALWPVAARGRLRDWLGGQTRRAVAAFGDILEMREVRFAAPAGAFANINTQAELAEARAVLTPRGG